MAQDLIRYDVLVQQALRGVVKKVLVDAVKDGLPGGHHFYISFNTSGAGVRISPRLKSMYPDEMTIVLQHQFWDLSVSDSQFEVSLSFDKIPERLVVPFEAVTGFFDPSVKFGLKFEAAEVAPENDDTAEKPAEKAPRKIGRKPEAEPSEPARIGKKTAAAKPAALPAPAADKKPAEPAKSGAGEAAKPADAKSPEAKQADAKPAAGEVVSLDAFRKKK
jgi:hypothetical protein